MIKLSASGGEESECEMNEKSPGMKEGWRRYIEWNN
jgi:hypothetical protein